MKKKTWLVCIFLMFLLVGCGAKAPSVDELCARGDYAKAYEIATETEKNEVLGKNNVALITQKTSNLLSSKNLDFDVKNAYYNVSYDTSKQRVYQQTVLQICGVGKDADDSLYILWTADEYGKWDLIAHVSNLTLKPDDEDYFLAVLVQVIVESDTTVKMSKAQVDSINSLLKSGDLGTARFIEFDKIDTSILPE